MKRIYLYALLFIAIGHFIWESFFEKKTSPQPEIHRFPAVVDPSPKYTENSKSTLRRPQNIQTKIESVSRSYLEKYPENFKKHLSLIKSSETDEILKLAYTYDGIDIVPFEILISKDGSQIPEQSALPIHTAIPGNFPKKSEATLMTAVSKTLNLTNSEFKMSSPRPLWVWNSKGILEAKYEVRIDYTNSENRKISETWYIDAQNPTQSEKYDRIKH